MHSRAEHEKSFITSWPGIKVNGYTFRGDSFVKIVLLLFWKVVFSSWEKNLSFLRRPFFGEDLECS